MSAAGWVVVIAAGWGLVSVLAALFFGAVARLRDRAYDDGSE